MRVSVTSVVSLCDSMGCSPPGSSVRGILQVRTLEWVAIPSSRDSSRHRDGVFLHWNDRRFSSFEELHVYVFHRFVKFSAVFLSFFGAWLVRS